MSFGEASEPVCARHPDRVTYVLCNRCGNGICTDCMVPAPVGFQCPACVKAGRVRTVRTLQDFVPRVTYAIIIACVAVQLSGDLGIGTSSGWVNEWSLFPARVAVFDEYYRLATAVFVHSGWLHLGMNMLMLWVMGRTLEQALGPVRFATLFALAGLGGAVASYWFNDPMTAGVGASGAIFGLFAGVFVLGREVRVNTQEIVGIIGLNLLIGFVIPGVDWHAHVGGLMVGAAVAWGLMPHRKLLLQVLVPLLAVALLAGMSSARTSDLVALLLPTATTVVHS